MRHRHSFWVAAALLLGAPSAAYAAPATTTPTSPETQARLAGQLSKDKEIPLAAATRQIALQSKAAGLPDVLKEKLGSDYGGIWLDESSQRLQVNVLEGTDRSAVDAVLAEHHLEAEADLVPTDTPEADLLAAQYTIAQVLGANGGPGMRGILSGVDTSRSRVVVLVGPRASSESRRALAQLATEFAHGRSAFGPPRFPANPNPGVDIANLPPQPAEVRKVDISIQNRQDIDPQADACGSVSCSAPLRGGVRILTANDGQHYTYCSAGFMGHWWSGSQYYPYMMTAGHCIYAGRNGAYGDTQAARWSSNLYPTGGYPNIGTPGSWRFGPNFGTSGIGAGGVADDIGIIPVNGSTWNPPSHWIWMNGWAGGDQWQIGGQATPYQNEWGCRSGATSTYTCGSVLYNNGMADYGQGQGIVQNLITTSGACPSPGDSGGPFLDGNIALGIVSGHGGSAGPGCSYGLYGQVSQITGYLGVSVLTSSPY